jgi:hypothetical protein
MFNIQCAMFNIKYYLCKQITKSSNYNNERASTF